MNQEYIEFVKSRAKGGDAILLSLTPEKCHLLHMAVGISGEAAELFSATTPENVKEELGDLLFYITGATFSLPSWNWEGIIKTPRYLALNAAENIVTASGDFLDLVKKYTVYNKPFDEIALTKALDAVCYWLIQYADAEQTDMKKVAEGNMTKLLKRYANGYSDKAAQERADKPAGE